MKLSRMLLLVLTIISISIAQVTKPYAISGTITSPVATGGMATQFWVIFKGLGTYPTDSILTPWTGKNWTYSWSSDNWRGNILIHGTAQGFSFQYDTASILLDGSHQRITRDIIVTDIQGPKIDSISVAPKSLKIGDTIILKYRTVDNLCRNTYKLISIQQNNGPWILVDSMLVDQGSYPTLFFSAIPNNVASSKLQKYVSTLPGLCKFQIIIGDSTGNKTTALSDTFRVTPIVSVVPEKETLKASGIKVTGPYVMASGALNLTIFNFKGQAVYTASGLNKIRLPEMTRGTYILRVKYAGQELLMPWKPVF